MAKVKGEVLERDWQAGKGFALRFPAYGERRYVTLGYEHDGWTWELAEEELANILADVRRGLWVPPKKTTKPPDAQTESGEEATLFGPFARELIAAREGQIADKSHEYEQWATGHLLAYFADWSLIEIDIEAVDGYRRHKVKEADTRRKAIEHDQPLRDKNGRVLRPLGPSSINKTIDQLQWILSVALEYKKVTENAAVGRRRRLKLPPSRPVYLDTAAQIEALIDAAAELDRKPTFHCSDRQAIIAALVLAGPRASELCHLLWRDVDLANGRIFIGRSKTQAGLREITMLPLLRDILAVHKARAYRSGPDDLTFPTGTGGRRDPDNLRTRILAPVIERANELLEGRGQVPLPIGLTTHKLRHTFASVLVAIGEDPHSVMTQLGHTDPKFTMRVYTHGMARGTEERARLKALVRGERVVSTEAPPDRPSLITVPEYRPAIMRTLSRRGGSATRKEVLAEIEQEMGGRFSELDTEQIPSGPLRWQALAAKARGSLVDDGLLRADSPRGLWELRLTGSRPRTAEVRESAAFAQRELGKRRCRCD
ncbi:MAG TPA: site-specific integrase [Solirubrobacterales bacterium]|nr:site-specific integrase [Solirubrobacterales bacterium]